MQPSWRSSAPLALVGALGAIATLGGCASVGQMPFTRFDAACAFVPSGMTSLWLGDGDAFGVDRDDGPVRTVVAGRRFRAAGPSLTGDGEFVFVEDWGASGAGSVPAGAQTEDVVGVPVWSQAGAMGPSELWCAVVDGRFRLEASRRAVLFEALRRPGSGAAELANGLGWTSVDWQARTIVVRRYDSESDAGDAWAPANRTDSTGRAFDVRGIAYEAIGGRAFRMRARGTDPDRALEFLRLRLGDARVTEAGLAEVNRRDDAVTTRDRWTIQRGEDDGAFRWRVNLGVRCMFGFQVFI